MLARWRVYDVPRLRRGNPILTGYVYMYIIGPEYVVLPLVLLQARDYMDLAMHSQQSRRYGVVVY